jgi:hypothetical protein
MRNGARSAILALALGLGAVSAGAQTTITTEPVDATTTIAVSSFAFGQTFMTPNATDVFLQSFRLAGAIGQPGNFTAQLFEFDPATIKVVGSPLFTGSAVGQPAGLPIGFQTFTPNVLLDPTRTYLFLLASASSFNFTYFGTTPYAGGASHQAFGSDVQSAIWINNGSPNQDDIAFTATFGPAVTPVPEPATVLTLGAGLLVLGLAARRRARGAQASASPSSMPS